MHQASPARERLLEGFLWRLAVARDADAFALRGGWLVRTWVPDAGRRVRDIDLICRLPYRVREIRARVREILATELDDGVVFEADRFRIDTVWPESAQPGLLLFARGKADRAVAEMTVDFTFQLDIWPRAQRSELMTTRGAAQVWTCPREMVIATKLAVIAELGPREWRPKDLADIWLVMRRFPPAPRRGRDNHLLGEAIERSFARSTRDLDAQETLTSSWWREPEAAARWGRYAARQPAVPFDLEAVISEVRSLKALAKS